MQEELGAARERYFWAIVLGAIWSSLIAAGLVGGLAALIALLDWSRHLLMCLVGLLAGVAVAVATSGSARTRELTGLVLGAVTLPLLAAHLAGAAAESDGALAAQAPGLFAFFAHAVAGVAGGVSIAAVWRRRPRPPDESELLGEGGAQQGALGPRGREPPGRALGGGG
jgi:hypothetical protein